MEKKDVRKRCPTLEQIGLAVELFDEKQPLDTPIHMHDMVEMIYVLEGTATHQSSLGTQTLAPGDLFVINYGEAHAFRHDRMSSFNVYLDTRKFSVPLLDDHLKGLLPRILSLSAGLNHNYNRWFRIRFENTQQETVVNILINMYREQNRKSASYLSTMRLYLRLFLTECCRWIWMKIHNEDAGHVGKFGNNDIVLEVKDYLDNHFTEDIRLGDVADRYGMSESYLCHQFKSKIEKTVFEYIIQRRIERVVVSLMTTDDKILSIALDAGFRDPAYFNRTFKRLIGTTPGKYRQYLRELPG